ncbi:hypothetical protein I3271_19065 [Photobacterium leiognathi]|uniref:capsular polysaccharide export protein, LipB/KpsS family n=1 Tax=Photobacterium leiognathi TaxID=553611 RepID=UPI001EDE59E9|nr:hypothetical protein [Photobacterium leiognathi]MCG3886779.1 hypothetical protein [Photobacterium leiognathi]
MNLLSLDPMYSSLHEVIAKEIKAKNKYAILTSLGLSIYLPTFKKLYINKVVGDISSDDVDLGTINDIKVNVNHFTSMLKKVFGREISESEIYYMSKFYIFLRNFLIENDIKIVLLHNDLRWQHSLCIQLCKELDIKYLVTEQGLFRPFTTIIDNVGVNAFSNVKNDFLKGVGYEVSDLKCDIKSTHNSIISYVFFSMYIFLSKIGRIFGYESLIVHKKHSYSEYIKRFIGKNKNTKQKKYSFSKRVIFIPLQLELDTQLLIHSDFNNNQEVIDVLTNSFINLNLFENYDICFKYHPNDNKVYHFDNRIKIISSPIDKELLNNVDLVISVNSSSILSVLETSIPLITIGRSIYNINGVACYSTVEGLTDTICKVLKGGMWTGRRLEYVNYLKRVYSLNGAGYDYPVEDINRVLTNLNVR